MKERIFLFDLRDNNFKKSVARKAQKAHVSLILLLKNRCFIFSDGCVTVSKTGPFVRIAGMNTATGLLVSYLSNSLAWPISIPMWL